MQRGSLPQNMLENCCWTVRQLVEEQLGRKVTAEEQTGGLVEGHTTRPPHAHRVSRVCPAAHLRRNQKYLQALQMDCHLQN